MTNAFNYVIAKGLDTEESYPYKGVGGPCHFNPHTIGVKETVSFYHITIMIVYFVLGICQHYIW